MSAASAAAEHHVNRKHRIYTCYYTRRRPQHYLSTKPKLCELVGYDLEWSTIVPEQRVARTNAKQCLFCGHHFNGGPNVIRQHLDKQAKPRNVNLKPCSPTVLYIEWH